MNHEVRLFGVIRINTRLRRRALVLAFYVSGLLGCGFSILVRSQASAAVLTWYWIGMVASFLFLTPLWVALVTWVREYGFPGDHRLHTSRDERQEKVRHAAYVRAYWILVTVVCLGSVVVLSSPTLALPHRLAGFSKPLAALCVILVMTLPSAVMTWTEPDLTEMG
jgi:hypothetical protein